MSLATYIRYKEREFDRYRSVIEESLPEEECNFQLSLHFR